MKKQSSRSQRGSKGIKGKHILQICVLLSVCIWLIYQVKYSHDKKKEFYEKDDKKSAELLLESKDGIVKLGRKDLLPVDQNKNEKEKEKKHVEEDEDEVEEVNNGEEEKEKTSKEDEEEDEEEDKNNKQGEEVVEEEDEEENKHEEDEIDEQDESKSIEDSDKDDELLEEEKESGLNESEEKEKETKHVDEIDMTVDEAREEHYKADDASSAVSHDSRVLKTEKLNDSSGNSTREIDPGDATREVKIQKEPVLKLGEDERDDFADKTSLEVKDSGNKSSTSETTELRGETVNGNLTEPILEASRLLHNETEMMREWSQEHSKTEDGAPPPGSYNLQTVFELEQTRNESDHKDTIQDEYRNSTSESSLNQSISGVNTTDVQENSRSESDDETSEKERSNQFSTEQMDEADDTSETTILQEEREALTDPQTLPDIRIEGNEEDE